MLKNDLPYNETSIVCSSAIYCAFLGRAFPCSVVAFGEDGNPIIGGLPTSLLELRQVRKESPYLKNGELVRIWKHKFAYGYKI